MKTITKQLFILALLASGFTAQAITNSAIAVSGTNIVLSWPSYGYESYLIQYRQTLDPSDSWSALTNAYHANSTNRTTFTIFGVVPQQGGNGGNYSGGGSPPFPSFASSSLTTVDSGPLAIPVGASSGAPVAIYPPGFDFSNFNIFDPLTGDSVSGAGYSVQLLQQSALLTQNDVQPLDSGSGDPPQTGFYRVFHIPSLPGWVTNYTFDGPTFIPVDYSPPDADLDHVDSTTVLIGGRPVDYAEFLPDGITGNTNPGVGIFFDLLPNGTNTIQLLTTVRQSDVIDGQTPYMVFSNAPATITIGNLITFTNCDDLIWNGTNYTFNAQTVADVDWTIDIYDWNGNWVNYLTGHSSDGNISWTWNLYDYWGNPRNNPDSDFAFSPYFTITGNLPSSAQNGGMEPNANSSASRWGKTAAGSASSVGNWVVAYQDTFYTDGVTNAEGANMAYSDGISSIVSEPRVWEMPTVQYPLKFGRTYTQSERNDSWYYLKSYLGYPTFRNFYYFGHGATNGFGCDMNIVVTNSIKGGTNFPGSRANIPEWYIRQSIAYNATSGSHPYRFVYLDCCNAGAGGLSDAFGIPKDASGIGWFSSANNTRHIRPCAFVGWNSEVNMAPANTCWQYRAQWISQWSRGSVAMPLDQALDIARDTSGWWSPSEITQHRKIYGAWDMTFRQ